MSRRRLYIVRMGCVLTAALLLLSVGFAVQSQIARADTDNFEYLFDDTDRTALLSSQFTEAPEGDEFGYATDGYIDWDNDDQGAIDSEGLDSLWTTKRAFAPIGGYTYRVNAYFRNYSDNGLGALGFTTEPSNDLADIWYPTTETGLGVAFHGGGMEFVSDGVSVGSQNWDGDLTDQWYWAQLAVWIDDIEAGPSMRFELYSMNENGEPIDEILTYTLSEVDNETFGEADALYGYFAASGERFDRIDNFVVQAAELLIPPNDIRSYKNEGNGDVFLGGDFIELGISNLGSFGTHYGEDLPYGFFGTEERENIGMSTNPAGFGVAPDLRMDYFMPGSEEERWSIGYTHAGNKYVGSNSLLNGSPDMEDDDEVIYGEDAGEDIANNVVTDESAGTTLKARSVGTMADVLETTQVISFERTNKFFRNEVTLKNVGADPLGSVRYMRSFDPDNTVDQGGDYDTTNSIPYTFQGGDTKAVVVADTSWNDEDPVYETNGSRSPILYYSGDARARVSTFGFGNGSPYQAEAYNEALPKGTSVNADQAISITFDVGTLAPGASKTVVYYTSLDNRDFSEVLQDITEDEAGFAVDKNGDNIEDDTQPYVATTTSEVTGKLVTMEVDADCEIDSLLVKAEATHVVQDSGYDYPSGLLNFTVNCGDPGFTTVVKQYYFDTDLGSFVARKYNPNTKIYFDIPNAVLGTTEVHGHHATTLTYSVQDGSALDVDGAENRVIVDPAGLGVNSVGAPKTGLGGSIGFKLGHLVIKI